MEDEEDDVEDEEDDVEDEEDDVEDEEDDVEDEEDDVEDEEDDVEELMPPPPPRAPAKPLPRAPGKPLPTAAKPYHVFDVNLTHAAYTEEEQRMIERAEKILRNARQFGMTKAAFNALPTFFRGMCLRKAHTWQSQTYKKTEETPNANGSGYSSVMYFPAKKKPGRYEVRLRINGTNKALSNTYTAVEAAYQRALAERHVEEEKRDRLYDMDARLRASSAGGSSAGGSSEGGHARLFRVKVYAELKLGTPPAVEEEEEEEEEEAMDAEEGEEDDAAAGADSDDNADSADSDEYMPLRKRRKKGIGDKEMDAARARIKAKKNLENVRKKRVAREKEAAELEQKAAQKEAQRALKKAAMKKEREEREAAKEAVVEDEEDDVEDEEDAEKVEAAKAEAVKKAKVATLLHMGGVRKRGSQDPGVDMTVHQLISFNAHWIKAKEDPNAAELNKRPDEEVVLVLYTNGRLIGFSRTRPTAGGDASENGSIAFKPLVTSGTSAHPLKNAMGSQGAEDKALLPSVTRLRMMRGLFVITGGTVTVHSFALDYLKDKNGYNNENPNDNYFKYNKLLPEDAKEKTQAVTLHPRDINLIALALYDGSVLIKSLHIKDRHQVLCKTSVAKDNSTPIPHLFFTNTGEHFVLCNSIDKTAEGLPNLVFLSTWRVPNNALSPNSYSLLAEEDKAIPRPNFKNFGGEDFTNEKDFLEGAPPMNKNAFQQELLEAKKKQEERRAKKEQMKKQRKNEENLWLFDQIRNNRGTRLLDRNPLNCVSLDKEVNANGKVRKEEPKKEPFFKRGHPIAILPIKMTDTDIEKCKKVERGESDKLPATFSLLLWKHVAQIYCTGGGALESRATLTDIEGGWTCAVAINLPHHLTPQCSSSQTLHYWLVGTEHDKLHLLSAKDSATDLKKIGTVALTEVLTEAKGIRAITVGNSAANLVGNSAAICVGFADGSVIQYVLTKLIGMLNES